MEYKRPFSKPREVFHYPPEREDIGLAFPEEHAKIMDDVMRPGDMEIIDSPQGMAMNQARHLEGTLVLDDHVTSDSMMTVEAEGSRSDKMKYTPIDLVKLGYMYISGMTVIQMAAATGATRMGIYKAMKTPAFKGIMTVLSATTVQVARSYIAGASMKAVNVILGLMDSEDENVRLKAATQILDRSGLRAIEQIEVTRKEGTMSAMSESDLVDIIRSAMKELPAGGGGH